MDMGIGKYCKNVVVAHIMTPLSSFLINMKYKYLPMSLKNEENKMMHSYTSAYLIIYFNKTVYGHNTKSNCNAITIVFMTMINNDQFVKKIIY